MQSLCGISSLTLDLLFYYNFSPAHVMPLLEIVRTEKTSPQVIIDLMTVGKIIKKVPVVVGNCTGFAVNRTFFPYTQGSHLLVHLGVDVFRIDRVITNFGMPMGPFQYAIFFQTCYCSLLLNNFQ
jgi:enoyl-CoA hydratase/3-hydroxyacyl-CoA dehydrogenase